MFNLLSRAALTGIGVGGGTLAAGSTFVVGINLNASENSKTYKRFENITEEKNVLDAPVVHSMPQYQFGMLYEVNNPSENGAKLFKCQLQNEQTLEDCSVFKVVEKSGNNNLWIGPGDFKNLASDQNIEVQFVTDDKAIYKVKTKSSITSKWQQNTSKKLSIFATDNTTKPLLTISVKGMVNKGESYRGPLQYVFAQATAITDENSSAQSTLETSGKKFKCDFPGGESRFDDCEIYEFFEEQYVDPQPANKTVNKKLKTPLTKANSIVKTLHYLIKFESPLLNDEGNYNPNNKDISIKVFTVSDSTQQPETPIKNMTFMYKFTTNVFGQGKNVDFAIVS